MVYKQEMTGTVGKGGVRDGAAPVGFEYSKTDPNRPTSGRLTTTEEIVDCRLSGRCPRCEKRFPIYGQSAQSVELTCLESGIDFIREGDTDDGEILAACCACGFSF